MKKRLFLGVALLFGFFAMTSCEDFNFNQNGFNIDEGLVGSASVVITSQGTDTTTVDSLHFISSIVDAFNFSEFDSTLGEGFSTIDISANINLNGSNVALEFPFMYYRIDDTVAGTYAMDTILTLDLLQGLNYQTLKNVLASPEGGNMVLIALNDSCWYITYSGNLVVTQYPAIGHMVKANLDNIGAWYVSQSKINELNDDINNMNYSHLSNLDYYFPRVTLSGSVTSRRWDIIHTIFRKAFIL